MGKAKPESGTTSLSVESWNCTLSMHFTSKSSLEIVGKVLPRLTLISGKEIESALEAISYALLPE